MKITLLIVALFVVALAVILTLSPVPQPLAYHDFADQRALLGIPNFLNVSTNLAFVLAGLAGLGFLWREPAADCFRQPAERIPYYLFFVGTLLIGICSAYYHRDPHHLPLFWDRLAMALVFMSFVGMVLMNRSSVRTGLIALAVLVPLGLASVIYWIVTEQTGVGDLRFYALAHFFPFVVVILLVLATPACYSQDRLFIRVLAIYAAALVCEILDREIYVVLQVISGHSLKHLLAALAVYQIKLMLARRQPASDPGSG